LACANYALYAAIRASIGYVKEAEKIGKVGPNDEKGGEQV